MKTYLKSWQTRVLMLAPLITLTACSKTVQWEEEVLLNTGDTIWLKRTMGYSIQGGAGNPFDMKLRPDSSTSTMRFSWQGKEYRYDGSSGFIVLAISPAGKPILVRSADSGAWDAIVNYKCTIPFYVQFEPDASGKKWTWPPAVEPWLYNLPANILREVDKPENMKQRYTRADKLAQSYLRDPRNKSRFTIDPTYTGDLCKNGGK
jgi:hypothetical protein